MTQVKALQISNDNLSLQIMVLKEHASQSSVAVYTRVIMLQLQRDELRKENSQLHAKEIELLRERERSNRDREALELRNLDLVTLRNSVSSSHFSTFAQSLILI